MSLQDGHACLLDDGVEFLAFGLVRELRLSLRIIAVSGRATRERCERYTPPTQTHLLEDIERIWSTGVGGLVRMDE